MIINGLPRRPRTTIVYASLLLLGCALNGLSQVGALPVVAVRATDPQATWSGNPGVFTFFRDGPTNSSLYVYYRIDGTATNGVDYAPIGNYVSIPAGVRTNSVVILPINKGQTNTETVVVTLADSPAVPPVNYIIGYPSNAVVYISLGTRTNIPPVVQISIPTNGSTFFTPANVPICANAYDPDGYVATVEFFANGVSLGVRTNNPMTAGPMNPFCLVWPNAPAGKYALTALATDNGGAFTLSDPVDISVLPGPPPTNLPPIVRITSPPNGAMFHAPVDVPIYAYATDPDGFVTSVEFFADTNSLGFGQGVCIGAVAPMLNCPTNVFLLIWSNAPLGQYALTAKATDNGGASTVSLPVTITILPTPPPPTNRPPIVSIVAVDPIAIEGTNCWPWLGLAGPVPTWSTWASPTAICRYFTNCGPKNATFAVRRYGDTNDSLAVPYLIGGSATNGVDYVPLPGLVTIPAGERKALITVVPLDDGPPDINSTVVLTLEPSTNSPPDYVLGFPQRAAALILEKIGPVPVSAVLPDKCFHLNAAGPDGAWFHVEYTTDFASWTAICTNQVVNGSIDFIDPDAPATQIRFYRAVPELNPPLQ
jgi:hypothetical protein